MAHTRDRGWMKMDAEGITTIAGWVAIGVGYILGRRLLRK